MSEKDGRGPAGIPGLRGAEHIGFTVPDLEEATRFLVDVIGCDYVYSIGPIRDSGTWMSTHLNVHPRAEAREVRFFRCGLGCNFEVFEYSAPGQVREPPRNSDVGGHHVALYVDDFDAALAYLRIRGVRILGEPTVRQEGASAGLTWVYFLAPWGMQFELVSSPNGRAYEAHAPVKLWNPRFPAR
jgi:catechol 2,3-dioxygenase-like lactoylglutathione lyase family enzyme